jgi:hypothetical protein
MIRVYTARHATEAHLVCGFLQSLGIAAIVRGEHLTGGFGELPVDSCGVWITDPGTKEKAERRVREFLQGTKPDAAPWFCDACGESLEGQFTACWHCCRNRHAAG